MPGATKAKKAPKKAPKKTPRLAGNGAVQPPLMLKVPAPARPIPPIWAILAVQEEEEESSSVSEDEDMLENENDGLEDGEEEEEELIPAQQDSDNEEPEPLPKKRKSAKHAKANKKSIFCVLTFSVFLFLTWILEKVEDSSDDDEGKSKIGFQFSILSLAQLQLPKARREPAAHYAELPSSISWTDLKDQLKIWVIDVLFPRKLTSRMEPLNLQHL